MKEVGSEYSRIRMCSEGVIDYVRGVVVLGIEAQMFA